MTNSKTTTNSVIIDEETIRENINFILSHFENQHELFPRTIMTLKTRGQRKIEYESDIQKSKDKIFEYFKKSDFRDYLIQKRNDKIKEKKKKAYFPKKIQAGKNKSNTIDWIERLLKTPIEDYRKQCLWRVLCPYLINIRKVTDQETFIILDEWLKRCSGLRTLDFRSNKIIEDNIKNVKQFLPSAKDKLKDQYNDLYHVLKVKDIFVD